jgi:hypothetical protein
VTDRLGLADERLAEVFAAGSDDARVGANANLLASYDEGDVDELPAVEELSEVFVERTSRIARKLGRSDEYTETRLKL